MSCSCGCSPCSCQPVNCSVAPCIIQLPDNPAQELTFENINTAGIGFYDSTENSNVQFRGIVSESNALTLTYDSDLHSIIIDFDDALLIADIPTASETERGIAEVATQAEANAGVVDNVIVTPAKLAGRTATETRAGIAEIATQAETNAGASDTTIVTPLKLSTFVGLQGNTTTWADSVARGAKVPVFAGQFGTQIDTDQGFVSYGTGAGEWIGLLTLGVTSTQYGATSLDLNGSSFTMHSGSFVLAGSSTNTLAGTLAVDNGSVTFIGAANVNFDSDTVISFEGTPALNDTLFGFNSSSEPEAMAINEFLSSFNTNSGWTNFSNSTVRKTGDCSTITLPELAQVVDTLIQTLGTSKLIPIP